MSDFKAKMHEIQFRLWELTALPRPFSWRGHTSKGKERLGEEWDGRREGKGWGMGRSGNGRKGRERTEGKGLGGDSPGSCLHPLLPDMKCWIKHCSLHAALHYVARLRTARSVRTPARLVAALESLSSADN